MYILDTNICIALNQEHPNAIKEFNEKAAECYISTIVLAELYKGIYCSQRIASNLEKLNRFLSFWTVRSSPIRLG